MIVEGNAKRARRVLQCVQVSSAEGESHSDPDGNSDAICLVRQGLRLNAESVLRLGPKTPAADANEEKGGQALDPNVNDIDNVLRNSTDREQLISQCLRILGESAGLSQSEWVIVSTLGLLVKCGLIDNTQVAAMRAMLLHVAISREYRLADRSVIPPDVGKGQAILNNFAAMAYIVLTSNEWESAMLGTSSPCDLADLVDGRLFLYLLGKHQADYSSNASVISKYNTLASLVKRVCAGVTLNLELPKLGKGSPLTLLAVLTLVDISIRRCEEDRE